ncbi:hypothetical protein RJ639_016051 [Escallonia herrerae]|uniref:rRNA biogenesis protein RRP36 n=1 Tax=Escallonia herrerae TaxID=1293975 RepID=A0AA89AKB7_9ASTE|nr:hypothetical protein RJ639_016051 [Escallonia herrerae]
MRKPKTDVATSSKVKFDESEEEEEEEEESFSQDEEEEIEQELADVTFEELQKARSDGSHTVYKKPNVEKKGGRANKNRFKRKYNFIYENELPAEKEELKKTLKKSNDPEVIDETKNRISLIDKQLKSASRKHTDVEILAKHKKKERDAALQGKQPYYLKKSEIRKQKLVEKYKELKQRVNYVIYQASGKLESFIEKRRRKNAAKDHKFMPYRRSEQQ